jgi:PIN domain nuclease of toxin-antitoxin system
MSFLLDTCTFIWLVTDPTRLSVGAAARIPDRSNQVWLSPVSVWEIIVKRRKRKLKLKGDIRRIVRDQVQKNAIRILPVRLGHVYRNRTLPLIHHDPFDRILICQALAEGLTILTPDHHIRQYPVPTEW